LLKNKFVDDFLDTLKQNLSVLSKKLSSYKKNNARRQDNKSEHSNEPDLILKLPEAENIKQYWTELLSCSISHNQNAIWIQDELEITDNINEMTFTEVTETDHKAPGVDQIQNFWFKKLTQSLLNSSRVL
jgi:hypothetical protein